MEPPPRPVSSHEVSCSDLDFDCDLHDDGLNVVVLQHGRDGAARHEQSA